MNKIIQYNKIKTVLINGKKKCIYMKPRGTREYVRHNKEFILLNRYLKLISKKLKKQKGGVGCFGLRCFSRRTNDSSKKNDDVSVEADIVFNGTIETLNEQQYPTLVSTEQENMIWNVDDVSNRNKLLSLNKPILIPKNETLSVKESLFKRKLKDSLDSSKLVSHELLEKFISGWGIKLSYSALINKDMKRPVHYYVNLNDRTTTNEKPVENLIKSETNYKQNFYFIKNFLYFGVIFHKDYPLNDNSYVKILAPYWLQPINFKIDQYPPLFVFPEQENSRRLNSTRYTSRRDVPYNDI